MSNAARSVSITIKHKKTDEPTIENGLCKRKDYLASFIQSFKQIEARESQSCQSQF
jgi:hypothetical protein